MIRPLVTLSKRRNITNNRFISLYMIVLVLVRGAGRGKGGGAHKLIRHLAGDGGIASEWLPRGIILFDCRERLFSALRSVQFAPILLVESRRRSPLVSKNDVMDADVALPLNMYYSCRVIVCGGSVLVGLYFFHISSNIFVRSMLARFPNMTFGSCFY